MLSCLPSLGLAAAIFAPRLLAQFAPYEADGLATISSPVDPGVKISYKEPKGACKTAFDTQQQYTGWVSVPGDYPTNIFFWFVAARVPTSALTIWLNGGPGSSSMFGFFTETGPCEVVERGADRLETAARDWGWDRASNMLFIDQPNQVGFSYDTPVNGTLDLERGNVITPPLNQGNPPATLLNGTFSSGTAQNTANTSATAAMAVWHMLQGFLGTFPEYNPPHNYSLGVNLFAESYGGKYGPVFFDTWEKQNLKRQNGSLPNSTLDIHLSALGIVNGCVDDMVQAPSYTAMMVNNTYGLRLVTSVQAGLDNGSFYQEGGCRDQIASCREANNSLDPENTGDVASVNSICSQATETCNQLYHPYFMTGRSIYDIAHYQPDSFPPRLYLEYLNSRSIQTAIGSVINFTDHQYPVQMAFLNTGDYERGPIIPKLAALLSSGVRIGLIYGDRDYICNWLGGEAVSLAVASTAGGAYATGFPSAGYAPIIVNESYIGGLVRQFGNLSFSRIYQAGHFVPAFQPETAFQVFARIIFGTSVSTGAAVDLTNFNTTGDPSASASLSLPPNPAPTCYLRAIQETCPDEAVQMIKNHEGVIINGVWRPALSEGTAGSGGGGGATETPSSTTPLTGVFTATSTPGSDNGATSNKGVKFTLALFTSSLAGLILSVF